MSVVTSNAIFSWNAGFFSDRAGSPMIMIAPVASSTSSGHQTSGNYTRHFFSYVVPPDETGEGTAIEIQLLSETLARERRAGDPAVHEWQRCKPGVS